MILYINLLFLLVVDVYQNKMEKTYQANSMLTNLFSENKFYLEWENIQDNSYLINYILPDEDLEDYNYIKKNLENIETYNFKGILSFGVIDQRTDDIEEVEEIHERIRPVLDFFDQNRILI